MTLPTIELVRVRGTHREVGHQLGEAGRGQIRRTVETSWNELPSGRSKADQLALAAEYRAFTAPRLPWLIEGLDACAEGAGVEPLGLFATSIEEIWYEPCRPRTAGRCSDIVAGPAATADGHLLVAHNNDLRPAAEDEITALEIHVPGDPVIFQLGGIPWLSVGWSSAGLSLTGNELSPNDERIGISRVRPTHWQRELPAIPVQEEHPILRPGLSNRQKHKLAPRPRMERVRHPNNSLITDRIERS